MAESQSAKWSTLLKYLRQKVDLTKYLEETLFNFDYSYDENSRNEDIYRESIQPLIDNAFRGANISCFAYGQTGSGKTFTMRGDPEKGVSGMYYLAATEIFKYLETVLLLHNIAKFLKFKYSGLILLNLLWQTIRFA